MSESSGSLAKDHRDVQGKTIFHDPVFMCTVFKE